MSKPKNTKEQVSIFDLLAANKTGDIGETTKAGHPRKLREVRPWFSIKYYASIMNMKDFMARSIRDQFVGMLSTTFDNLNLKMQ